MYDIMGMSPLVPLYVKSGLKRWFNKRSLQSNNEFEKEFMKKLLLLLLFIPGKAKGRRYFLREDLEEYVRRNRQRSKYKPILKHYELYWQSLF